MFRHDGTEGDRRMGVSTEIELGGCSDMMAQMAQMGVSTEIELGGCSDMMAQRVSRDRAGRVFRHDGTEGEHRDRAGRVFRHDDGTGGEHRKSWEGVQT